MKFIPHYSSSSGNLYEVRSDSGRRILIECGIPYKKLIKALDYRIQDISGCFGSHLHADHSKSIPDLLQAGVDVYASAETFAHIGCEHHRNAKVVSDKTLVTAIPDFQVYAFEIHHDCPGALGFIVREIQTDEYLLFVTDTSHISRRFTYPFSMIAIECSYDLAILEAQVALGQINETVAKRLLTSHMERKTTLNYIQDCCDLSKCHSIYLLHASGDRLDKKAARAEIEEKTFIRTYIK